MEDIYATYKNGVYKIKVGNTILYRSVDREIAIKRYPNGFAEIIYQGKTLERVKFENEEEFNSLLEKLLKDPIKS